MQILRKNSVIYLFLIILLESIQLILSVESLGKKSFAEIV